DDIWLPLFSVWAAKQAQNAFDDKRFGCLFDAAMALRKNAVANAVAQPVLEMELAQPPDDELLASALKTLASLGATEPAQLATAVSEKCGVNVNAAPLGKLLKQRLAITSTKKGGRRVYNPLPAQIAYAMATLDLQPETCNDMGREGGTDNRMLKE